MAKIIQIEHDIELISFWELPADHDFENEESSFFEYRGQWYDLADFPAFGTMWVPCPQSLLLKRWHALAADSFFSGIVLRLSPDCETVSAGLYLC
jgi:hypothetical protein